MKRYKTVLLPLDVPKGRYCWRGCGAERDFDSPICGHFDNAAGVECAMQLGQIVVDGKGRYLKPKTCLRLKTK